MFYVKDQSKDVPTVVHAHGLARKWHDTVKARPLARHAIPPLKGESRTAHGEARINRGMPKAAGSSERNQQLRF
jgi:hypothetical protein